jgi:hypothetical protein
MLLSIVGPTTPISCASLPPLMIVARSHLTVEPDSNSTPKITRYEKRANHVALALVVSVAVFVIINRIVSGQGVLATLFGVVSFVSIFVALNKYAKYF